MGQGPRIIWLLRELWKVLVQSDEERLLEYLGDLERVTNELKKSKTHEERVLVASRISTLLKQL